MEKTKEEKKGLFFRFINGVEVIGNKLPHPFYLFTILIVVAIVLSVIFAGVSVTYESASSKGTGGEIVTVTIKNLLNKETINYVTQNLYSIYYNFSPMMMMGLLVCVQIAQGMVQWTPWVIVPFTIANQVGGVAIPSVLKTFLFGGILGILIAIHFKSGCFKAYEC